MSKRRAKDEAEETAPEKLTPEERRAQRRRDKAPAGSGKRRRAFDSPARRALILGLPAVAIVAVVAFLLFNPFNIATPCLTLQPATTAPYYPPAGTTNFTQYWCPPGSPVSAYVSEPYLSIEVNGSFVGLPLGIGVNKSYAHYTCTLPITTPTQAGELPANVFVIASPWYYQYNLSWFFGDWAATYGTVDVDSSHPSQTVTYTGNDLLGFTADASHTIGLFVDNRQSTAGPRLGLAQLDYMPNPFPSCIGSVYGTGHRILLVYAYKAATAGTAGIAAPTDLTGPGLPSYAAQLWSGPGVRLGPDSSLLAGSGAHEAASLNFLFGRGVAG